jgi:curved DNA-binding protein CbpA
MNTIQEQEILKNAYFVLGLEAGASLDAINRRYKRLIMVWHPDRLHTDAARKEAEDELKKINDARDKLTEHFKTRHNPSGACACKPQQQNNESKSADSSQSSRAYEAEGASRRKQEEAKRAAQEAAERMNKEKETQAAELVQAKEERLRWKVSAYLAATWLALIGFSWGWEHTHPYYPPTIDYSASNVGPIVAAPPSDPASVKRQQEEDLKRSQEENWIKKADELRSAKIQVDSCQRAIADAAKRAALLEAQLADPNPMSETQRANLLNYQNLQKSLLSDAQTKLVTSQKDVATLEAQQMPPSGEVETKRKKEDDSLFIKTEISWWQLILDQAPTTIAALESQLANPAVSYTEKQNLVSYRDAQRKSLNEAQENLPAAQKRLGEIGGKS